MIHVSSVCMKQVQVCQEYLGPSNFAWMFFSFWNFCWVRLIVYHGSILILSRKLFGSINSRCSYFPAVSCFVCDRRKACSLFPQRFSSSSEVEDDRFQVHGVHRRWMDSEKLVLFCLIVYLEIQSTNYDEVENMLKQVLELWDEGGLDFLKWHWRVSDSFYGTTHRWESNLELVRDIGSWSLFQVRLLVRPPVIMAKLVKLHKQCLWKMYC